MADDSKTWRNELLAALSPGDRRLLAPRVRPVKLRLGQVLEKPGKPIRSVYFMEDGLASVVAGPLTGRRLEVGLFGREGMSGVSLLLGDDRPINETFIQVEGSALRLSTSDFQLVLGRSRTLHRALLPFANVMLIQVGQTALANSRSNLQARLARWLLMMRDRSDQDDLFCTHAFLALMLGVRRAGVTEALHALEGEHLIRTKRNTVRILDRVRLAGQSDESYGVPEAHYARLIRPRTAERRSRG